MRAERTGFGLRLTHVSSLVLVAGLLAGCEGAGFGPSREASRAGAGLDLSVPVTARAAARDVPAPEVFQVSERGLWDGRPSLGGIWVAHPAADSPERVLIRNTTTGTEVVGALFRRERENPGPRFQISSEAAAALGIIAGQPADIDVTALRVERIEAPAAAPAPAAPGAEVVALADAGTTPEILTATAAATEAPQLASAAPVTSEAPPRWGLREMFRRQPAEPAPAQMAAAPTLTPATAPESTVAITDLDPPAAAPRRSLLDSFRRTEPAPAGPSAISQTALAPTAPPAAPVPDPATVTLTSAPMPQGASGAWAPAPAGVPLAGTAFLDGGVASAPRATPAASPDESGHVAPVADADPAPRRGLRDLFRRRPAPEAEPMYSSDSALIPLPEQGL